MLIFFILGLLLGGVTVIFAFQNIETIAVTFFTWQLEGSMALILIMSVLTGMLIILLFMLPELIGAHFKYQALQNRNKDLEDQLRKSREAAVFAQKTPPSEEVIAHIEQGSITQVRP